MRLRILFLCVSLVSRTCPSLQSRVETAAPVRRPMSLPTKSTTDVGVSILLIQFLASAVASSCMAPQASFPACTCRICEKGHIHCKKRFDDFQMLDTMDTTHVYDASQLVQYKRLQYVAGTVLKTILLHPEFSQGA